MLGRGTSSNHGGRDAAVGMAPMDVRIERESPDDRTALGRSTQPADGRPGNEEVERPTLPFVFEKKR